MKNIIRKQIKKELLLMTDSQKNISTKKIIHQLENNSHFQKATNILMYWATNNEVQTAKFIKKWSVNKNIYLPVIIGNNLKIKKYNKEMFKGTYNICEPIGDFYEGPIDLVIVPGIAFDKSGNRLGRGKGYYDRLLSKLDVYKIGICYKCQIITSVPLDKWDIKMDEIIF